MSHEEDFCGHLNEIIDEREGTIICTDCGLILSQHIFYESKFNEYDSYDKHLEEIKELLERLNLPQSFASAIFEKYKILKKADKNKKYLISYSLYKTLNEMGFPISIKDISAVSGIPDNYIYDMQESDNSIILTPTSLLEKYCKLLELDYKTYSVIKGMLPEVSTGHNPLTIIASTIYKYCKENKLKYSMKQIATTVNISSISIQRYLKKC